MRARQAPADHRRRRRASTPAPARRSRASPSATAFRSPRRRPASARCPGTIRCNVGAIGVTGSAAANALAARGRCGVAVGTRLQDFTTGSAALFQNPQRTLVSINVRRPTPRSTARCRCVATRAAALEELAAPRRAARARRLAAARGAQGAAWIAEQSTRVDRAPTETDALPTDAQVLGAVNRAIGAKGTVVCAAGGLPGELHKLWRAPARRCLPPRIRLFLHGLRDRRRARRQDGRARPRRRRDARRRQLPDDELRVATSVADGHRSSTIVLARQPRLWLHQPPADARPAAPSSTICSTTPRHVNPPHIDFVAHAAAMGAHAEKAGSLAELEDALARRAPPTARSWW